MKTAKAAMINALIRGETLNIKNGFRLFGLTNIPREVSRQIEKPFNIRLTRIPREGKSRYGQAVVWYDYKLDTDLEENKSGIAQMIDWIIQQGKSERKQSSINQKTSGRVAEPKNNDDELQEVLNDYLNEEKPKSVIQSELF